MTKIFWVTCPQCNGEFYCHYQELRHKKIKLLCPYCSHQFLDEESAKNRRVRKRVLSGVACFGDGCFQSSAKDTMISIKVQISKRISRWATCRSRS